MALCLQLQLSVGEFSARLRHTEGRSDPSPNPEPEPEA